MQKYYYLIGERIREIRIQRGLTQENLAAMINMTPVYISYIETGNRHPKLETFISISIALSVPLKEIFNFDSAETTQPFSYDVFEGCSDDEKELLKDLVKSAKNAIHINKWEIHHAES